MAKKNQDGTTFGDINLEKIFEMFDEHGLAELVIEDKDTKIKLRKDDPEKDISVSYQPQNFAVPQGMPVFQSPVSQVPSAATQTTVESAEVIEDSEESKYTVVRSPMVGTFYRAPSPTSPPFVDVGKNVNADTTLCIVEAMKVMNEIKAETSGKVVKILVENAQPVEEGQAMFYIE